MFIVSIMGMFVCKEVTSKRGRILGVVIFIFDISFENVIYVFVEFVKVYCLITLICPIILISHIAQLLLICKFYCFRKVPHISFKYARHNHLRCPMMGEVSLET